MKSSYKSVRNLITTRKYGTKSDHKRDNTKSIKAMKNYSVSLVIRKMQTNTNMNTYICPKDWQISKRLIILSVINEKIKMQETSHF